MLLQFRVNHVASLRKIQYRSGVRLARAYSPGILVQNLLFGHFLCIKVRLLWPVETFCDCHLELAGLDASVLILELLWLDKLRFVLGLASRGAAIVVSSLLTFPSRHVQFRLCALHELILVHCHLSEVKLGRCSVLIWLWVVTVVSNVEDSIRLGFY